MDMYWTADRALILLAVDLSRLVVADSRCAAPIDTDSAHGQDCLASVYLSVTFHKPAMERTCLCNI
jgi:hypothetical protein